MEPNLNGAVGSIDTPLKKYIFSALTFRIFKIDLRNDYSFIFRSFMHKNDQYHFVTLYVIFFRSPVCPFQGEKKSEKRSCESKTRLKFLSHTGRLRLHFSSG